MNPRDRRLHARQKTVANGTAEVKKGERVASKPVSDGTVSLPTPEQIRSVPQRGAVPEYSPTYPTGLSPKQSQPLDFQMTDPKIEQFYGKNIWPNAPSLNDENIRGSGMSMSDLKSRMDALSEAMWKMYRKRDGEKFRVRDMRHRQSGDLYTNQTIPWNPHVDANADFDAANTVADYDWAVKEFVNDWMPDLTDDPASLAIAQQQLSTAAARGQYMKTDDYWNQLYDKKAPRIQTEEEQFSTLFDEYNRLKNEYNTRLAQYLQDVKQYGYPGSLNGY